MIRQNWRVGCSLSILCSVFVLLSAPNRTSSQCLLPFTLESMLRAVISTISIRHNLLCLCKSPEYFWNYCIHHLVSQSTFLKPKFNHSIPIKAATRTSTKTVVYGWRKISQTDPFVPPPCCTTSPSLATVAVTARHWIVVIVLVKLVVVWIWGPDVR